MLASCRAHGLLPIVTYNHFTVPRWFAMRGGWEVPDSPDLFARFCERATRSLGDQIGMASPFNEANIHLLVKVLRKAATPEYVAKRSAMIAAAARATDAPQFSSILFTDPDRIDAHLLEAHAKAYQAIKAGPGEFPVGVTLTTQAIEPVGEGSLAPEFEALLYGSWWDAINASDFVGVQAYTRFRVDSKGIVPPPPGAELTAAGYEYYPQALGQMIRLAARKTASPSSSPKAASAPTTIRVVSPGSMRASPKSCSAWAKGSTLEATFTGRYSTTSSGPRDMANVSGW